MRTKSFSKYVKPADEKTEYVENEVDQLMISHKQYDNQSQCVSFSHKKLDLQ